jgi:glycosyltransferase involved in cell wall biosynthesis
MSVEKIISVVTVCRNAEKTLAATIESIRRNKNEKLEYVVIDGNSSDRTLEIIKNNVKVIDTWISESDKGISDAFNKGISLASGKYIIFLNADDTWRSNTLETMLKVCNETESDIICFSMNIKKNNRLIYVKSAPHRLESGMYIAHPAALVKKVVYNEIGNFDLSFKIAMDYEFFLRAYKKGRTFMVKDIPIVEMNGGGISDIHPIKAAQECYRAYCLYETNFAKRSIFFCNYVSKRWLNRVLRGI